MLDIHAEGSCLIEGPIGPIEVFFDKPKNDLKGLAIVTHPQPLLGGNAQHKIPQLLARGVAESGWLVARPNFRGVGRSAGIHDKGIGETEDILSLCSALLNTHPNQQLALIGFSFGSFVQACVARMLLEQGKIAQKVCLIGMPTGEVDGGRFYATPDGIPNALVVHGESDKQVPLQAVLNWARPQSQPVTVIPGADHFFAGRLSLLRSLVLSHLTS
jgi:uncharacterized protein